MRSPLAVMPWLPFVILAITGGSMVGVATASPPSAPIRNELFKILPDDGESGDLFGHAISLVGPLAFVGAQNANNADGIDDGAVYVMDIRTGEQVSKISPDDGLRFGLFGRSVAANTQRAVIGKPFDTQAGIAAGAAYLFDVSQPEAPLQSHKLVPNDLAEFDDFGSSVALSGNVALVGAGRHDSAAEDAGAVYVYDATTGVQLSKITSPDPDAGDGFGSGDGLVMRNDLALIPATGDDEAGNNHGAVYLYDLATPSAPQLVRKLTPTNPTAAAFGVSAAMNDEIVVVGQISNDQGTFSGSATVFDLATGDALSTFLPPDVDAADRFGRSIALSGDYGVITAITESSVVAGGGSAYLYDFSNPSMPRLLFEMPPSDVDENDNFGIATAMRGSMILIGSRLDDDLGGGSGSVYLFTVPEPTAWLLNLAACVAAAAGRRR